MYHFDAERIAMIVQSINIQGAGKGEFLTLTQREKPFNVEEGLHGTVVRMRIPANVWDIKLSIMKGSPTNALLSTRIKNDMLTGNGVGQLLVKDLEGESLVTGVCFLFPNEVKYSTDVTMVEWEGVAEIRPDQWYEGAARFLTPQ